MENFNYKEYQEMLRKTKVETEKEYEETLRRIEAKVKKEMKEEFLDEFARIALGVILGNILWSMGEYLLSL